MIQWLTSNIVWVILAITFLGVALWAWWRFRASARPTTFLTPEQAKAARKRIREHSDAKRKEIDAEYKKAMADIDNFLKR